MKPPSLDQWARSNPPRKSESIDDYYRRYRDETDPTLLERGAETVEQLARGGALGATKFGTSMVGGLGEVLPRNYGGQALREIARETEQGAQEFFNPQGTAGAVGEFVGRGLSEIGGSVLGGGLAAKALIKGAGLAKAGSRAAQVARYLGEGVEQGGAVRRALANVAVNAPVDILQGAYAKEGLMADTQGGAILENILLSGAGGALSGAAATRRAARTAAQQPAPITDPRRLLPSVTTAAGEDVPMVYRQQFPAQPRGTPDVTDLTGPGATIPMRGPRRGPATEPNLQGMGGVPQFGPLERTASPLAEIGGPAVGWPEGSGARYAGRTPDQFAVVPYRQQPALPVSGRGAEMAQEVSDEVLQLRQQLERMSPKERNEWMAINMPGTSEEELLQILTSRLPGGPLEQAEAQTLRGVKAPKMRPSRRGLTEAQILESVAGAGLGGAAGFASGDTEESRLAMALAGAAGGAALPFGIRRGARFFERGAAPTAQAAAPQAMREAQIDIARNIRPGDIPPPKLDKTATQFPENRRPLINRMGDLPFEQRQRFRFEVGADRRQCAHRIDPRVMDAGGVAHVVFAV